MKPLPPDILHPVPHLDNHSENTIGVAENCFVLFWFGGFYFSFFFNWGRQWGQSLFFKGGNYVPEIAEREMAGGWQRAGAPGQRSRALLTLDGPPAHCKQLLNRFPTSANVLFGQGSPPPPPLKGSFIICLQKCSTPSLSFFVPSVALVSPRARRRIVVFL